MREDQVTNHVPHIARTSHTCHLHAVARRSNAYRPWDFIRKYSHVLDLCVRFMNATVTVRIYIYHCRPALRETYARTPGYL